MSAIVRRAVASMLLAGAVGASLALPAIFEASQSARRVALPVFPDAKATRMFVSLPAPVVARPKVLVKAPVVVPRRVSRPPVHVVVSVPSPVAAVTPDPPVVIPPPAPAPVPAAPTPPVSAAPLDQTTVKVIASALEAPVPPVTTTTDEQQSNSGEGDQGDGNSQREGHGRDGEHGHEHGTSHGHGR